MGISYAPIQATARGSANARNADRLNPSTYNTLPHMSEKEIADMMAERERKRKEEERQKRLAEIEAAKKKEEERLAYIERRKEIAKKRMMAEAKSIAPDYRREYDAGDPQTFRDAKNAADETYMQFWYDKANAITDKWTEADYKSLVEPRYEKVVVNNRGTVKDQRAYPEGYEEFLEIKERIDYGVLDFTSKEDHKKLIKPPTAKGGNLYGKKQYWIDESNPLRQAVEAQSAVMKEWLDEAGIDIVIPYSELDGFKRPDPMRGEGIYLNTGTGAHIDWDSGLKRMQHYQTVSDDGGFGEYSTAFIRPDPDFGTIGKVLSVVGTITGNPVMRNIGIVAQGGDWKDIAKGYLAGKVTAPILEETFATLGVDADLLGIDPDTFSESMMEVQKEMIEGGSGTDALIGEFTKPVVNKIVDTAKDILPDIDIDFETPALIKDVGDVIVTLAESGAETLEDVVKPIIDIAQTVTEPVVDVVKEVAPVVEDVVIDPVKDVVQAVTEPVVKTVKEVAPVVEDVIIDPIKEVAPVVEDIVIDPIKQGVEATVDTIAEIGEPVIDTIDDVIDTFGSEVVDPTLQAIEETGEKIIDPIDDAIDAFGSEVVDPLLETGSDILSDAEDVVSDVLSEGEDLLKEGGRWLDDFINWESLFAGGAGGAGSTPRVSTPTESLFGKELFKFDTEIKSTSELLSPMMNLRKYG
jgi:hypothetical protein